jgi:hypothetical protein
MKVRTPALCLVVTFVVGVAGAHAQGPPADPGGAASLAARITALEARVTALETIDESDIIGRYQFAYLGIELNRGFAGTPGTPARMSTSEGDAVVTLNADHSVQFSEGSSLGCTLPILTFGVVECEPQEEEEGPGPPTWSFANGLLTIGAGDPDDQLVFRVGANGVFVAADSSEFQPGHGWAVVFILSKLAN